MIHLKNLIKGILYSAVLVVSFLTTWPLLIVIGIYAGIIAMHEWEPGMALISVGLILISIATAFLEHHYLIIYFS